MMASAVLGHIVPAHSRLHVASKGRKDSNLVVVSMLSKGLSVVNPIEGGLDLDKMLADARKAPLLSE